MYFKTESIKMKLDTTDKEILNNLLVDARLSARQLALKLGISTVTVLSRIKKLEKDGTISGYSARLSDEKIGYQLTGIIEVVAKKSELVSVEEELAKLENVCAVYDITGGTDTLIIAKFRSRDELSRFVKDLATIPNVENTITHLVLNTIKEDFRLLT